LPAESVEGINKCEVKQVASCRFVDTESIIVSFKEVFVEDGKVPLVWLWFISLLYDVLGNFGKIIHYHRLYLRLIFKSKLILNGLRKSSALLLVFGVLLQASCGALQQFHIAGDAVRNLEVVVFNDKRAPS
jgi:hypothetical protein